MTAGSAQAIRGPTAARLVARIADAPLASDGARWVAFQRSGAQRPTLVDASRGAQRRLPGGCDIADIRRAVFLLRCGPDRRAELLFPDRGRLEKSREVLLRLVGKAAPMAQAWLALAQVSLQLGDTTGARAAAESTLALAPGQGEAQRLLEGISRR